MIYDEPRIRVIGDSYVGVEFGDDADLRNNFRVIALVQKIESLGFDWILEVVPTLRELGVVFDRFRIEPEAARAAIAAILPSVSSATSIRSRLFRLPVWYRDPWSQALNEKAGLEPSIEIIARSNQCSVDEVIQRHSGTDHWLSCVGWAPGCYFAYPVDRKLGVTAPKLKTARPYTPERILALGGLCTAALPFAGPSGYQMLGRLAAPIYRAEASVPGFPEHGVLFRAGDRHRYVPVGALEYEAVQEKLAKGAYQYDVTEEEFGIDRLEEGGYADP